MRIRRIHLRRGRGEDRCSQSPGQLNVKPRNASREHRHFQSPLPSPYLHGWSGAGSLGLSSHGDLVRICVRSLRAAEAAAALAYNVCTATESWATLRMGAAVVCEQLSRGLDLSRQGLTPAVAADGPGLRAASPPMAPRPRPCPSVSAIYRTRCPSRLPGGQVALLERNRTLR